MSHLDATTYFEMEMDQRGFLGLACIVRFEHMQTVLGNLYFGTAKLRRIVALSNQRWKLSTSHGFEWVHDDTVDAMTIFCIANQYRTGLEYNVQVVHQLLSGSLPCCIAKLVDVHPFLPLKVDIQTGAAKSTKLGDLLRFLRRYPDIYQIDPLNKCVWTI